MLISPIVSVFSFISAREQRGVRSLSDWLPADSLCRELIASSATADGPARALLLLLLLLLLLDARAPVIVSNGRSASELTEEEFTVNGQLKKRRDVKRRRRRWRKRRTGDSASTGFGEPR